MAISAKVRCGIDGRRTLTSGVDNISNPNLYFVVGGTTSLTASTTPDGEQILTPQISLSAGAYTIDLTACPDVNGTTTSISGLKPRALFFKNNSSSNNMTFAKGASNGLPLVGSWTWTLLPGGSLCIDLTAVSTGSITAVDASNKTIDVSGTGTDSFDFGIIAG